METFTFQEKKFILHLLSEYEKEYGNNMQFIHEYKFGVISLDIKESFPFLYDQEHQQNNQKLITPWFKEACARGYLIPSSSNNSITFKFSDEGYQKALALKHPIKTFAFKHWMWTLGIVLTIINTVVTVTRLVLCP